MTNQTLALASLSAGRCLMAAASWSTQVEGAGFLKFF